MLAAEHTEAVSALAAESAPMDAARTDPNRARRVTCTSVRTCILHELVSKRVFYTLRSDLASKSVSPGLHLRELTRARCCSRSAPERVRIQAERDALAQDHHSAVVEKEKRRRQPPAQPSLLGHTRRENSCARPRR